MHRHLIGLALIGMLSSGCLYRAGNRLIEGMLDEAIGDDRADEGVDVLVEDIVQKKLLRELGNQLGEGLTSGATDISPEKRKELEDIIDGLIAVASARAAKGLREEVGPEFRNIAQREIIGGFADGLRGKLGRTLQETIDRLVDQAATTLRRNVEDPATRLLIAEVLRDAVYEAVNGGTPASPGIGETLESTLTNNVLDPFSDSVGGVADRVAYQVDQSAQRTENLLKTIISALAILLGVLVIMYFVRDRQARRARQKEEEAQQGLRSVGAAIDMLDDTSRKQVFSRLEGYNKLVGDGVGGAASTSDEAPKKNEDRSDDYLR